MQTNEEASHFVKLFDGKEAIQSFTEFNVNLIKDGKVDALLFKVRATALKKALDAIDEQTRENIMNEVDKYPEKSFKAFGVTIEKAETGVSYDFSTCNDLVLNEFYRKAEELKAKIKERENHLKTLKEPVTVVDEETGETTKIYPPLRKSQSFIKISFK